MKNKKKTSPSSLSRRIVNGPTFARPNLKSDLQLKPGPKEPEN